MGQDYRLTQAYEQMLKGNKQPSVNSSPKSLMEAYGQILTERRMAFYAKEVDPDTEEAEEIEGLENLGIADNSTKIMHTIGSQTVQPVLLGLFEAAGEKWKEASDFEHSLLEPISREFVAEGITSNDIIKLIKNKNQLNDFELKVKGEKVFKISDDVSADVSKVVPSIKPESSKNIFNYCFNKKVKISDINVGHGEIALSLLTNCKKGEVGDLDLPSGEAVEVKVTGGRIGKPSQVNPFFGRDVSTFLSTEKAQLVASKELSIAKKDLTNKINVISSNERFKRLFEPTYLEEVELMISFIDSDDFATELEKAGLWLKGLRSEGIVPIERVWAKYNSLNYLKPPEEGIPVRDSDKEFVFSIHKQISDLFKQKMVKGGLEKLKTSTANLKDLKSLSFGQAIQQFFFGDFGLSSKQIAKAFLLLAADSKSAEKYLPDIEKYFEEHYADIQAGNLTKLEAAIFGLQLGLYANSSFKYLLLIETGVESKRAISFNCQPSEGSAFKHLSEKYLNYTETGEIKLSLGIRADERGGSQISFK
jgi:hypothetical protein